MNKITKADNYTEPTDKEILEGLKKFTFRRDVIDKAIACIEAVEKSQFEIKKEMEIHVDDKEYDGFLTSLDILNGNLPENLRNFPISGRKYLSFQDIRGCSDILYDPERECLEFEFELWCDVDKIFGTKTRYDDSSWINLYGYYFRDGSVELAPFLEKDDSSEELVFSPTEEEKDYIRDVMNSYCREYTNKHECSEKDLDEFLADCMEEIELENQAEIGD